MARSVVDCKIVTININIEINSAKAQNQRSKSQNKDHFTEWPSLN